jgi:hypothetical protein
VRGVTRWHHRGLPPPANSAMLIRGHTERLITPWNLSPESSRCDQDLVCSRLSLSYHGCHKEYHWQCLCDRNLREVRVTKKKYDPLPPYNSYRRSHGFGRILYIGEVRLIKLQEYVPRYGRRVRDTSISPTKLLIHLGAVPRRAACELPRDVCVAKVQHGL